MDSIARYIPPYATEEDIKNSMSIVKAEIDKNEIIMTEEELQRLTIDVMSVSYSRGGGYSSAEIKSYIGIYITRKWYKEFFVKDS